MGIWALFLLITSIFEATKTNLLKNAHIKFATISSTLSEKIAIASSSFLINLILSLLFILFIFGTSDFLGSWLNTGNQLSAMLIWFIPGIISMIFFSHLETIQQSNLDFKGVFIGYFVRQGLFFAIIVFHLLFDVSFSLVHLVIYQSVCIILGTLALLLLSRKYLSFSFRASGVWTKKIMGFGGYIFGSGMLSNIFSNIDQIMTASFMSSASVAYYNTASRINGLVDIPSYAAADVLFPKISQASANEGETRIKYLYEKMVSVLLSFTTPAAIFIICFPTFVIKLIAGNEYIAAAPILQLYMITGLLRPMQNQAANILNSMGKPKLCFVINAISLVANLCINYVCLLNFGFYGAAIGTLVTCTLGSLFWYFIMKKQINIQITNIFIYMFDLYKNFYMQTTGFLYKKIKMA